MGSTKNVIDGTDVTTSAELLGVRNEALRETLRNDVYGSDMKFTVQALNDATPMSSETLALYLEHPNEATETKSSAAYNWIFRGRIIDYGLQRPSPHIFLTDPCDIKNTPNKVKGVMTQMQQLYTDFIISTDKPKKIKRGDQIIISMRKGQPYKFDLQFAFANGSVEEAESSNRIQDLLECQKLSDLDYDGNPASTAKITWSLDTKQGAAVFFQKLKNHRFFSGFSDNFLWGAVTNAQFESGIVSNIGGDPESLIGKRHYTPIKGFCSFGYWQLQLCSKKAEGTDLLADPAITSRYDVSREPGVSPSAEKEELIFNIITNEEMQFAHVSKVWKRLFPNDYNNPDVTPYDAAYKICYDFERPRNREIKCKERADNATTLASQNQIT